MKAFRYLVLPLALTLTLDIGSLYAQQSDSTGLPGDNFSLEGALELFRKAANPEDFERLLNTESNHVNNLDLDGDGKIDYIRVVGKKDDDATIFILQVPVTANENQDIAVIEIETTGKESASIQIIGDEEIFGEAIIVEPGSSDDNAVATTFTRGPSVDEIDLNENAIINVWLWPSVRYVYAPGYRGWISPWRWNAYPGWWKPWHPVRWHAFHPYRVGYRRGFAIVHTHRLARAHKMYTPIRTTSVVVRNRNVVAHKNYTVNRTRTTVTGPRGNSVTRKTTTVKNKRGNVKARKSTVRKRRH
ncbi:MAG: hypothetical protein H7Y31_06275 [Chitinophagaceae bacterium]|nr:hypothetical protein [Chitinophagaceae bacterium]